MSIGRVCQRQPLLPVTCAQSLEFAPKRRKLHCGEPSAEGMDLLNLKVTKQVGLFIVLNLPVSELAKCIAWGCLLSHIVYYNVYCDYFGAFIEKHVYTKFHSV